MLFDEVLVLDSSVDRIRRMASFKRRFEAIYMDHFAANRKNILLANANAHRVITPTIPDRLPSVFQKRLEHHPPDASLHESTRYLRFVDGHASNDDLNEGLFLLTPKKANPICNGPYITLQPGSGNNQAPWKTWPIKKWKAVIEHIHEAHPELNIVLLGDESEDQMGNPLTKLPHVINAIGKTDMHSLPYILAKAKLHIGNDSGLLHISGCVGTPTVTIWGGSDPGFYGWHLIEPKKHEVIKLNLDCGPCSRWLKPNISRVEVPTLCPDFRCLNGLSTDLVNAAIDAKLNA